MDLLAEAVGRAIYSEFGSGHEVYLEEVKQGALPPCFFVRCDSSSERQYFGARYYRERRFCVSYFPADENGKNGECEAAAQRLLRCLERIVSEDGLIMGRKMSYGVKDGALYFFVNYGSFVYRAENKTVMGDMEKRVGVR